MKEIKKLIYAHNLLGPLFLVFVLFSVNAKAVEGWSINVGYQNPTGANIGAVNFLKVWKNWAFEFGYGQGKTTSNSNYSGPGFSWKYLFNGKSFRPYLHVGVGPAQSGLSFSGSTPAYQVGTTSFVGAGFFWSAQYVYLYAGANAYSGTGSSGGGTGFGGVGFDF